MALHHHHEPHIQSLFILSWGVCMSVLLTNLHNALMIENYQSKGYHIFLTIRNASYLCLASLKIEKNFAFYLQREKNV
jgi:hypothetical protein